MPFVKRHRDYYKYGTEPNATVVGNFARIDKGIANGFSAGNYIITPELFNPENYNTWEMFFDVTTSSDITTAQAVKGDSGNGVGSLLQIESGKFRFLGDTDNSTTWNITLTSTTTSQPNTKYTVKIAFTGSEYQMYINDILEVSQSSSSKIKTDKTNTKIGQGTLTARPWLGSINLNKSYIKINDELWWSGDSYTKVGSWIDDGVVSGFSTSQYLTLPETFKPESNPWEMCFKIHTPKTFTANSVIFGKSTTTYHGIRLETQGSGEFYYLVSNASGATFLFEGAGSHVLPTDTDILIKFSFTGSKYVGEFSIDNGDTWIVDKEFESTTVLYSWDSDSLIGCNTALGYPATYSIDLSQSYIKINNEPWWHGTKAYQINVSDKDVYENWKQPVLTGNSSNLDFIVSDSKNGSTYLCFDNNNSTGISPHTAAGSFSGKNYWVQMESSTGLNVTNIAVTNRNISESQTITAGSVQVSNNGYDWIKVTDWTNNNTGNAAIWNIPVSYEGYYKYIRLVITDGYSSQSGNWISVHGISLTATQLMPTGTIEDADYSIPRNKLYQLAKKKRHYYKYDYRDYTLKNMTGYSSPEGSVSQTISDDYYTSARYQLFWNREMAFNTKYPTGTVYVIYQFPYPLKKDTYNITMYGHTQSNNNVTARIYIQYTDNEELLLQEKLIQHGSTTSWNFNFTASKPIKRIGFHGVANPWNSANTVCTLGGFNIKSTTGNLQTYHGVYEVDKSEDADYYIDGYEAYTPVLKNAKHYVTLFESETAGTYSIDIPEDSIARVTLVGGGGAAAIRGVYDDRGYGWSGGSAGAYRGIFALPKGTYNVTVASANNNTSGQGGNTATLNPSDTSTHDSYISGVVRVGGGGAGTTSGVGAAGAAATFEITPMETLLNSAGKAGAYGSGGKGSGANATMQGGASVYKGYGAGQGCSTSEYAARRYWIDGTGGFVKIEIMSTTEQKLF